MLRRLFLASVSVFAALALPTKAEEEKKKVGVRPEVIPGTTEYPQLRAGTQLDHLYESLLVNGFGIRNPNVAKDAPTVVLVSDTQCPWCSKLWKESLPLADKVNFVWYFVPVLRDLSASQAALILSSPNPWKMLGEHEEHFKDADFRGINPKGKEIPQKFRDEVWTNAKIARWSGVTSVPLGVFKTQAGQYVPIFSGTSAPQLKKIIFSRS